MSTQLYLVAISITNEPHKLLPSDTNQSAISAKRESTPSALPAPFSLTPYLQNLRHKYHQIIASSEAKDGVSLEDRSASKPSEPASESPAQILKKLLVKTSNDAADVENLTHKFFYSLQDQEEPASPAEMGRYNMILANHNAVIHAIEDDIKHGLSNNPIQQLETIGGTASLALQSITALETKPCNAVEVTTTKEVTVEKTASKNKKESTKLIEGSFPAPVALVLTKIANTLISFTEDSPFLKNTLKLVTGLFMAFSWMSGLGLSMSVLLPHLGLEALLGLTTAGAGLIGVGALTILAPLSTSFFKYMWEALQAPPAAEAT